MARSHMFWEDSMLRDKLIDLRERAYIALQMTIGIMVMFYFLACFLLLMHVMQPILSPVITLALAATVVVRSIRAGWFTATLVCIGLAMYVSSFAVTPFGGIYIAQAICGTGLIICLLAGFRSFTPPQQRCMVAA